MFTYEIADGIAAVTLNRPPANAINLKWTHQFHRILDELELRDDWSVLHIRSGLRIFSGGADIKEMRSTFEAGHPMESLIEAVRGYQGLFARIEALSRITLAEIGGAAMGGGFELALACDLRIVADEAKVGLPEIRIGLLPGAGGTQRLTRLCGKAVAMRIIGGAEMVDGLTAVELGMAQWHAPAISLPKVAAQLARRYAGHSALALCLAKRCISAALDSTSSRGFDLEYEGSKTLLQNPETHSLITRFLAKKDTR
jgi:enoyl-CoA hydratase